MYVCMYVYCCSMAQTAQAVYLPSVAYLACVSLNPWLVKHVFQGPVDWSGSSDQHVCLFAFGWTMHVFWLGRQQCSELLVQMCGMGMRHEMRAVIVYCLS